MEYRDSIRCFQKLFSEDLKDKIMYHVTPMSTYEEFIRREGILPRRIDRGFVGGNDKTNRIYLFIDRDTAEDGLANWLADLPKFEKESKAVILSVDVSNIETEEDPEIAGSYFTKEPIPLKLIKNTEVIDLD